MPGIKWKPRRCFECGGPFKVRLERKINYCPYCGSPNVGKYADLLEERFKESIGLEVDKDA